MTINNMLIINDSINNISNVINNLKTFDSYHLHQEDEGILQENTYFIGPRNYYSDGVFHILNGEKNHKKGWLIHKKLNSNVDFIIKVYTKLNDYEKPVLTNEFKLEYNMLLYVSAEANQFIVIETFYSNIQDIYKDIKVYSLFNKKKMDYFNSNILDKETHIGTSYNFINNQNIKLTNKEKYIQFTNIFPTDIFQKLQIFVLSDKINWYKIQGQVYSPNKRDEIYTQSGFNILEYAKSIDNTQHIILRTLEYLNSKNFLEQIKQYTSKSINKISEIYMYKLNKNEKISVHCDEDYGQHIISRLNIIIVDDTKRKFDFLFHNKNEYVKFKSIENSAVYFYFGLDTPHEVLPVSSNTPRINIIVSFS